MKQKHPSTIVSNMTEEKKDKMCRLSVTSEYLMLNGQKLPYELKIGDIIKILGKSSRKFEKGNILHVYDDIGLVVYQLPNTVKVISLSLFFSGNKYEFAPFQKFYRELRINGKIIMSKMSINSINGMTPTLNFSHSQFSQRLWKARIGRFKIFIRYIDNTCKQMERLSIEY